MSNKVEDKNMTPTAKQALVPKLRFPEFRDAGEWEGKRLSRIVNLVSGLHLSPEEYSKEGEIPYFTGPSDFTNRTQDVSKWTGESTSIAKENDTLITVKGSGVGELWYLTLPAVAMGRQLMAVRTINGSGRFIFQFLLTKRTRFEDLASGNLIPGLSRGDILDLEARFPSLLEQQKIADCLSSLDELITLEARKFDALKAHKKGLMQQLFPAEGETLPELRFPEFRDAGEWEEKTIASVANLKNGYAFKSSGYADSGKYHVITISNVQSGELVLEQTKMIESLPPDIQPHQHLDVGDILISMTGNVGRVCYVNAKNCLLNQRVGKFIPANIQAPFFYSLLQNPVFLSSMQQRAVGGAQGNLSSLSILSYAFKNPRSMSEQQKIADCLSSLDDLIALQSQKLDALKAHKKGLLQQLFPSLDEVKR